MSDQSKAIIRRLIESHWNGKRAALVGEFFAPTVSLHTPDGVLSKLEGASNLLQAYATAFPDFQIAIDDLISEADQVVVRYTFTGTHRGPLGEIPATGRSVNVPNGILIFRLAGDKVSEGYFSWNKYALLEQLGIMASTRPASAHASS
jgi:predicted ester cyclase